MLQVDVPVGNDAPGPSRRQVLRTLGKLILVGSIPSAAVYGITRKIQSSRSPDDYFFVLKQGDNTYVERDGRVLEVVSEQQEGGRGIDEMVRRLNKQYDPGDIQVVSRLTSQLIGNPSLENIGEGEIVAIPYYPMKAVAHVDAGQYYPILQQRKDIRNLASLLQSSRPTQ